jgi:hypothetical protein
VPSIRSKNFLPKPYDADTLLGTVKRCLDSDNAAPDETSDAALEGLAATV